MDKVGNRRKAGVASKLGLTMLVLGLLGTVVGIGTWSAFSATTGNSGNSFATGTVAVGDDDSSAVLFNLSGMAPGTPVDKCIKVTYTGSLDANVKVYGSGTGSLRQYLDVTIARGTGATSFPSCTGYSNVGTVYTGTLNSLGTDYGTGSDSGEAVWSTSETYVFKISVSVANNNAAQGLSTTDQVFTFEAHNN